MCPVLKSHAVNTYCDWSRKIPPIFSSRIAAVNWNIDSARGNCGGRAAESKCRSSRGVASCRHGGGGVLALSGASPPTHRPDSVTGSHSPSHHFLICSIWARYAPRPTASTGFCEQSSRPMRYPALFIMFVAARCLVGVGRTYLQYCVQPYAIGMLLF